MIPVRLEDVAFVEQNADLPGVTTPQQLIEVVVTVQLAQALQEFPSSRLSGTHISPRSLA